METPVSSWKDRRDLPALPVHSKFFVLVTIASLPRVFRLKWFSSCLAGMYCHLVLVTVSRDRMHAVCTANF